MGETDWHMLVTMGLLQTLRIHLRDRDDVHVASNMFVYYAQGDPTRVVCPDLFVAFGVRPGLRRVWKTWEEGGRFPQFVAEVTSRSTRDNDMGSKKGLYELLGAEEYVVFDPLREAIDPRLRGWRREGDVLLPMRPEPAVGVRRLHSTTLGLMLEEERERIRLIDPQTGTRLLFSEENDAARREAEAARREAEAEVARLRALVERLQTGRNR
jgi:Uma2 family endonuclease